jgi:hypothetical protein
MSGDYVGVAAAVCSLRERGWGVQEIAAQLPNIQKTCGNEAIRAAGMNGGPVVLSLYEHMERFGESVAERLRELRADDISSN